MPLKEYTLDDVAKHNTTDSLWLVIHGRVYDVTKFQEDHPGGIDSLLEHAGTEATSEFEEIFHSEKARKDIEEYLIGELKGYDGPADAIHQSGSNIGNGGTNSLLVGIPIVIALVAFIYQFVLVEE